MNIVLLVEDSPADVMLVRKAAQRCAIPVTIEDVSDGTSALAFLRQEAPYEDAPRVSVVLLDINLPGRSGREILEEIRSDPRIARTPVIVLTSSSLDTDVNGMYDRYASSYHVKPATPRDFDTLFRALGEYWFRVVALPTR